MTFICRLCQHPIPEPPPIVGERPTERYIRIGQSLALHLQQQHHDRVSDMFAAAMQFQTHQLYSQYTCPTEVADEMKRVAEHLRDNWLFDATTAAVLVKP